ncbi:hypothetical protein UY3_11874 [Chelonia mydas]|uniref:Uncharacterized protein n=1 Tax=Chelonia mydas TaxID=8469 RepID=M7AZI8_CHEMY|nr:hypothetical protein UY3_11874 [Chelonia mydas]
MPSLLPDPHRLLHAMKQLIRRLITTGGSSFKMEKALFPEKFTGHADETEISVFLADFELLLSVTELSGEKAAQYRTVFLEYNAKAFFQ